MIDFRFEYLYTAFIFLRSVYDSYKYQGIVSPLGGMAWGHCEPPRGGGHYMGGGRTLMLASEQANSILCTV